MTMLTLTLATIVARILAAAILLACVLVLVALVRHDMPMWLAADHLDNPCHCGPGAHHPSCSLRGVA